MKKIKCCGGIFNDVKMNRVISTHAIKSISNHFSSTAVIFNGPLLNEHDVNKSNYTFNHELRVVRHCMVKNNNLIDVIYYIAPPK